MHTRWIAQIVLLSALLGALLVIPLASHSQELDKAKLAERVITAHTRYEEKLSGLSGYQDLKTSAGRSSTQRFDILGRFVRNINGPYQCDESETSDVEGLNGDYFFTLSRRKGAKDWKLEGVNHEMVKSSHQRDLWRLILNPPLLHSTTVGNFPLRELFKEEAFELKSAKLDGKDLIVEFSAKNLVWRKGIKEISGTVTLRNDANLLVQSAQTHFEYVMGKSTDETLIVTYDESRGMPLVVKSINSSKSPKAGAPAALDIQFDLTYRDEKTSPADFLLTAFNLPEPNKPEPKDPKGNQEPPK